METVYQGIENNLLEYLDGLESQERIERIDDLLHRLNFERRLTGLTEHQLEHMHNRSLSEPQRAKLDQCQTEKAREELLNHYARAQYFRDCAWVDYLNGTCNDPPCPATPPASK